jgi:hypothetical protein
MSGSHFGSGYWPDDYFGLYFQPEAGGVIAGTLAGSFAGTSSFNGSLAPTVTASSIAGTVSEGDVERIARFLRREKQPIGKVYKRLLAVKRDVPEASMAQVVKAAKQYAAPEARKLTAGWINFAEVMRQGDQVRLKMLMNNAIMAAETARAADDDDDEDTLMLLYA